MSYQGDLAAGDTLTFKFNSAQFLDGAPATLAGTPSLAVYKTGSSSESTAGVTLNVDYDSKTGLNNVIIDTSSDGTFYANGNDFDVMIVAGTVGGTSVVGRIVGSFSIGNRSALRPTTKGRTFDVSAGGEGGVDWANVGSPTTSLNLSGTTISNSQVIASVTAKTGYKLSSDGLDAVDCDGANARQALAVILATQVGQTSGAGTGTFDVSAYNAPATTRVSASVSGGNRTAVTVTLPT